MMDIVIDTEGPETIKVSVTNPLLIMVRVVCSPLQWGNFITTVEGCPTLAAISKCLGFNTTSFAAESDWPSGAHSARYLKDIVKVSTETEWIRYTEILAKEHNTMLNYVLKSATGEPTITFYYDAASFFNQTMKTSMQHYPDDSQMTPADVAAMFVELLNKPRCVIKPDFEVVYNLRKRGETSAVLGWSDKKFNRHGVFGLIHAIVENCQKCREAAQPAALPTPSTDTIPRSIVFHPNGDLPTTAYGSTSAGIDLKFMESTTLPTDCVITKTYGSEGVFLGYDVVRSCLATVYPQPTIPAGHFGMLVPRSSAAKNGYEVVTGIIDAGYTGDLKLRFKHHTRKLTLGSIDEFELPAFPIAQLVMCPMANVNYTEAVTNHDLWEEVVAREFSTAGPIRGNRGFGSSDKSPYAKK